MPGFELVAAERERLAHRAPGERDHRTCALDLADRRLAQRLAAGVDLLDQAREQRWVAADPLDRPRERVRRRLVPGDEHRHELVADLGVAHRAAVLVRRLHHQREHVGALGQLRIGLRRRDQLVEDRVELRAQPQEARPRRPAPAEPAARFGHQHDVRAEVGPAWDQPLERLQALALGAEHRAQDRAQRDPLHRPRRVELDAARPLVDLLGRDLGDHRLVALHPLALERRQQQLALLHVLPLVDRQQRMLAEHRSQRAAGARVQHRRIGAERLLDQLRIGHDDRLAKAEHADREDRAEAAPRALQVRALARAHRERLQRHRRARARRRRGERRRGAGRWPAWARRLARRRDGAHSVKPRPPRAAPARRRAPRRASRARRTASRRRSARV